MTKDFNDWWDSDLTPMNNPYREDSPAYWAWAGWVAGAKAERDALVGKVAEALREEVQKWSRHKT